MVAVVQPASSAGKTDFLTAVPEGMDALVLGRLCLAEAARSGTPPLMVHIARDDRRLEALAAALAFFTPAVKTLAMPAWDTVPYDRIGPNAEIMARRITTLSRLALATSRKDPTILLTTANAMLQRVPPRAFMRNALKPIAPGQRMDMNRLIQRLSHGGFTRSGTVMEPGEFAVRGGILDVFPPGRLSPVRLDFFGDTLESIKSFDAQTQRSDKIVQKLVLMPISEVAFGEEAEKRFRTGYVAQFGAVTVEDPMYQAVSAGQRYPGIEHWLPLFHETMETLFDYTPGATLSFDHQADKAVLDRVETIRDHYQARVEGLESTKFGAAPYKPLPPDKLFVPEREWKTLIGERACRQLTPFEQAEGSTGTITSFAGRPGRNFAPEPHGEGLSVFDSVRDHILRLQASGKRVVIAAWTPGARERLATLLRDHGIDGSKIKKIDTLLEAEQVPRDHLTLGVLGLEHGFDAPELTVISEQDILGDRLVRPKRKARKAADVISEATSLSVGDLVVHADHGIGRFEGLKTITALGAPHDCLELVYAGGDKLYLPVENIELLSRFGSDETGAQLDKLGGASWQTRKAKLKQRLREIASELIRIAALRQLKEAPPIFPPAGAYEEFIARFPYEPTEDQEASINAVLDDLGSGKPMDRLICGDVGFGKTEVALRAAMVAALGGYQVAVVVPTTLLARQHFRTFKKRFEGLPVRIAQASRMVTPKELADAKAELKSGQVDIIVGTHALLSKQIEFARLGLIVIDEEQHFGVAHKERLKQMREDVHVLTLSATPIPRTLQLALSGVRELSLITTPPVDRLAVRTYISPFDPVIIREALRRERYRGGQSFYVCPRLSDLDEVVEFLTEQTPELRIARAHGQLASTELEDIMTAFYEGQYDVLVSTAIVESGLDIPNANTMIVHRADMFGLAQLYQLRGRVGRSKTRAYAYFTTPTSKKKLTDGAEKRLKVLQSLDTLGAGFSLASHDLDIRGAGNLLGDEQSGHIREVGFELYQQMLEEAIAQLKGSDINGETQEQWSPQISLGLAVLIPEAYVSDLQVRLGLYRRLSSMATREDLDIFAAELVDRFGELPEEVRALLDVMEIKGFCRAAGIQQIDAGVKGAILAFRKAKFSNPEALAAYLQKHKSSVKLQPDHKLLFKGVWDDPAVRLKAMRDIAAAIAGLVAPVAKQTAA
jgi:transcription-repair coupling factor (superfamily II helicase)